MSSDVEKMYLNLNKLLEDICTFLSDENKLEKLSPKDRKFADILIKRSKVQLQEISRVVTTLDEPDEAYVDMEEPPIIVEEEGIEKNNIYSCVDDPVTKPKEIQKTVAISPYRDLPAKEMSREIKYGYMMWKTRFIYFNTNKRIFAGIHDNWLLIYCNEKDSKPSHSFDLKCHNAKEALNMKQCKEMLAFQLTCTISDKTYTFLAQTYKDMLQWISKINRCHGTPIILNEMPKITDDVDDSYDLTINSEVDNNENIYEDNVEDIYQDIEEPLSVHVQKKRQLQKSEEKPPDLPSRRPMTASVVPVPEPLPKSTSIESIVSYDQVLLNDFSVPAEEDDSFTDEDDEEPIYNQFVEVRRSPHLPNNMNNTNNTVQITRHSEEEQTNYINAPNLLSLKPKVKEKPKIMPKSVPRLI